MGRGTGRNSEGEMGNEEEVGCKQGQTVERRKENKWHGREDMVR